MTKRRRLSRAIIITIVVLVALRIALPYIVLKYVNKTLANLDEYYGHVVDIDIALIRGAYTIKDFHLYNKVAKEESDEYDTIPFIKSQTIDISLQWRALFKGKIVGQIEADRVGVNFVKNKVSQADIESDTADFVTLFQKLMPLQVNRFEVTNSEIHYIDPYASPPVDVELNQLYVLATNLKNVNKSNELLPAKVKATANVYGGSLGINIGINPLAKIPTFDLDCRLDSLDVTNFNNFAMAYGKFDIERGMINIYAEAAAKNGKIGGYVKPLVYDLQIATWDHEDGDIGQILREGLIDFGSKIFKNHPKDQLGTKVTLEGTLDDPNVNVWSVISYTLRNAFLEALLPQLEQSINIYQLNQKEDKTFLQRVFGKDDKKDEKKE